MDHHSIAQLRTATDLVTSRLAVDLSPRRATDAKSPSCDVTLTEILKARRHALGWSAEEVCGRSGIDRVTLTEWEGGIGAPRLDAATRWAAALGLGLHLVPADGEAKRGIKVDWAQRRIAVDGNPVRLTPMEWKALERLARVPGEVVTHQALFHHLYGDAEPYRAQSTAIRVLITKLRRLLPLRIEAKWGKGYVVGALDPSLPTARAGENGRATDAAKPASTAEPARVHAIELAEPKMIRPAAAQPAPRSCRTDELGVIERFLTERGATRCPDAATIQQSPLPTLVWDKIKRKWVRPSAE